MCMHPERVATQKPVLSAKDGIQRCACKLRAMGERGVIHAELTPNTNQRLMGLCGSMLIRFSAVWLLPFTLL